jgi:hypothetical protein
MTDLCVRLAYADRHDATRAAQDDILGNTLLEDARDPTHLPYLVSTGYSLRLDALRTIMDRNEGICPMTRDYLRLRAVRNDALCVALRAEPATVASSERTATVYKDFLASVRSRSHTTVEITLDHHLLKDSFVASIVTVAAVLPGSSLIVPVSRPTKRQKTEHGDSPSMTIHSPPSTLSLQAMWNTFAVKIALVAKDEEHLYEGNVGTCPIKQPDGSIDELEYLFCRGTMDHRAR